MPPRQSHLRSAQCSPTPQPTPRAPPSPPQASPLTAFPAALKVPPGPCFPHFWSTLKTRAKACPHGPWSSTSSPSAADTVLSGLGTLLPSRAALSPCVHSCPASLPLPRAALLWPGPTEATVCCSVPPLPLLWPSGTPAAQPSLHTSLRGFHWGPHPCPLGSCCPIKWTSFGERGTRETDAEDTNRTLSSIYKSQINNECF